jgi:putative acetyltransferase
MRIRPFEEADAPDLAGLFYEAVHVIARRDYSEAQVRAWAPEPPPAERIFDWARDGRLLLVAVDSEGAPLAFGDLEADGHIDHLFCHPRAAGTGVTAALYAGLEAAARAGGVGLLYVEASEPARRFFLRRGFRLVHRRDFDIAGVPIHNYRMEKRLAPQG